MSESVKTPSHRQLDEVTLSYVTDLFGEARSKELLGSIGSTIATLNDLTTIKKRDLWQMCLSNIVKYDDEGHGVLSKVVPKNSWSMIYASVSQMPDLNKGLKKFVELVPLLQCGISARATSEATGVTLSIFANDDLIGDTRVERWIELFSAYFQSFISWTTGEEWLPSHIRLSSLLPAHEGSMLEGISGCTYSRHGSGVAFGYRKSDLSLPLGIRPIDRWAANETLVFNKIISARLAPGGNSDPLLTEVERILEDCFCSQSELAKKLFVSVPTLQRNLSRCGSNYRTISEKIRSKRLMLLLQTSMSVEDIAADMGFSDRRSLTRASKKWLGETPSQYRSRDKSRAV